MIQLPPAVRAKPTTVGYRPTSGVLSPKVDAGSLLHALKSGLSAFPLSSSKAASQLLAQERTFVTLLAQRPLSGPARRPRNGCYWVECGRCSCHLCRMVSEPEPDLKLIGLSIWVDGRQFPNNPDFYDGNWLNLRARMEAPGATVKCAGSILMTSDFQRFRDELHSMGATLAGEATLAGYEPDLKVVLKMQRLGHLDGEVEITPDHVSQFHRFTFELDQTYLPALIASCDSILERFPIVGAG